MQTEIFLFTGKGLQSQVRTTSCKILGLKKNTFHKMKLYTGTKD